MTDEVKFIHGNDRINQLAQRPDIVDGVTRVRAEMAEADRTYAIGLAALRQAAELTQAAVSRIEQPHDLLLSTLNSYLGAIGGHASVSGYGGAARATVIGISPVCASGLP